MRYALPLPMLGLVVLGSIAAAQETPNSLSADEVLWQSLESRKAEFYKQEPSSTEGEAFEAFLRDSCRRAGELADGYRDLHTKFPAGKHADDAWDEWIDFLQIAAYRNDARKQELKQVETACLADPLLPKSRRRRIRENQIDRVEDPIKGERMVRQFMHEVELPKQFFCMYMVQIAQVADARQAQRLVDEVLQMSNDEKELAYERKQALALQERLERIGKPLELSFESLRGGSINLKEYRGKVVLIQFWATWCPPCVAKIPDLKRLRRSLGPKGLEIVSITYDADRDELLRFVQRHKIEWPQFFDERGIESPLVQKLGTPGPPAYWLVDRDGILVEIGETSDFKTTIHKLLED